MMVIPAYIDVTIIIINKININKNSQTKRVYKTRYTRFYIKIPIKCPKLKIQVL